MSYRCQGCHGKVPHGTSRLLHIIYRWVGRIQQIAREIPVCKECKTFLDLGGRLADIRRKPQIAKTPKVVPAAKHQHQRPGKLIDGQYSRPIGPHVKGLGMLLNPNFFTFQPRARQKA